VIPDVPVWGHSGHRSYLLGFSGRGPQRLLGYPSPLAIGPMALTLSRAAKSDAARTAAKTASAAHAAAPADPE